MSVESPEYEVLKHDGSFELRRYAGYLTANVRLRSGDHGRAMNAGFEPRPSKILLRTMRPART